MFERNKIETGNSGHQTAIAAEIVLDDGEVQTGSFIISASRAFGDVLNGEAPFLEFEPFEGERRYIARQSIRSVKLIQGGAPSALSARRPVEGSFDPYSALGVKKDAPWEEVRHAYLRLAKTYHADRFASIDLPSEVRDYLQQMSRRINAAYVALETPRLAVVKAQVSGRSTPVYTSQPR